MLVSIELAYIRTTILARRLGFHNALSVCLTDDVKSPAMRGFFYCDYSVWLVDRMQTKDNQMFRIYYVVYSGQIIF